MITVIKSFLKSICRPVVKPFLLRIRLIIREELTAVPVVTVKTDEAKNAYYDSEISRNSLKREDIDLLTRYQAENLRPNQEFVTDFLGGKHRIADLPHIAERGGEVAGGIPIPSDGFHAEAIEYVALLMSVEEADDDYVMFELGAGYGPWMCSAALSCKKKGIHIVDLVGVEGQKNKMPLIQRHMETHDIPWFMSTSVDQQAKVKAIIYDGVIAEKNGEMKFPIGDLENYGASLSDSSCSPQNVGIACNTTAAYSFESIASPYDLIDLVHFDLQGYEIDIIRQSIEVLKQKVRYLAIATHSRKIEGLLPELLYSSGFFMLREQPCWVTWPHEQPDNYIDITYRDGMQVWKNSSC